MVSVLQSSCPALWDTHFGSVAASIASFLFWDINYPFRELKGDFCS